MPTALRPHRPRGQRTLAQPLSQKEGDAEVKSLWGILSLVGLFALLQPAPVWTQPLPAGLRLVQADRDAMDRWQRMTPQEREELRERYRRWQNLSPAEKQRLRKKFEAWHRLSPEERAAARRNFERWQKFTPAERERLRERWERWRRLPPEQREQIRGRMQRLRNLPPERRREIRERFRERFERLSPEIGERLREPKQRGTVEEKRQFRKELREKLQER